MKLHIIMHESFEAPAAIQTWAQSKEHTITYTRLYQRETFPRDYDFDFLIVMGGPQCPTTTVQECPHFDAKKEIQFIERAIEKNKMLLGICLGAQLIGEALGAKFEHSPNREIGVFNLMLTEDGKQDSIFSVFPEQFPVGHWHGDMPGLTPESKILAISEGCPRQIVKYGPRIFGFQCHFEFTLEAIEGMIRNCADELAEYKNLPYIQNVDQLRKNKYAAMNQLLFQFLDALVRV